MVNVGIGPGDDVEAWCTRCKMNLNHRVIAMVGREIKRVHCLTCGGDHKYYPPKYPKSRDKEKQTVRVSSREREAKKPVERSAARALSEWNTVMSEMPPDTVPRPYRISDSYGSADFIEHPVFGTGRVLDILGSQRMEVIFREGRKVLICNTNRKE